MNFLIPYFVLALSWLPMTYTPDAQPHENLFMSDVTIGVQAWDFLTVEGQIKTVMQKASSVYFQPYQDEYYVRAFVEYKGFLLGAEHVCYHPVDSAGGMWQYNGGHNRVYFEFDTRGLE